MSGKEIFYNQCRANGVSTAALRKEQIQLLKEILMLEQENCSIAAVSYTHLDVYKRQGKGCKFMEGHPCSRSGKQYAGTYHY